jgi:hypothetical protein
MQMQFATYSAGKAVTPDDNALISCRAIYVGGAGNITVQFAIGTSVVFTAPPVGSILPINLEQGRIMASGTTATLLVALN